MSETDSMWHLKKEEDFVLIQQFNDLENIQKEQREVDYSSY